MLGEIVPPPERFRVTGAFETPQTAPSFNELQPLLRVETEEAGLHDFACYLRLLEQGQLDISTTSMYKLPPNSTQKLYDSLLEGDFFPPAEKLKFEETIRPFGLHVFAVGSGLISGTRSHPLTDKRAGGFSPYAKPENPTEAFENWSERGGFEELNRIEAIGGLK